MPKSKWSCWWKRAFQTTAYRDWIISTSSTLLSRNFDGSFSGTSKDSLPGDCKSFDKTFKIRIKKLKAIKVKNNKVNLFDNSLVTRHFYAKANKPMQPVMTFRKSCAKYSENTCDEALSLQWCRSTDWNFSFSKQLLFWRFWGGYFFMCCIKLLSQKFYKSIYWKIYWFISSFQALTWTNFVLKACFQLISIKRNENTNRTQSMHCYRNQNWRQKYFLHFWKPILTYGQKGKN